MIRIKSLDAKNILAYKQLSVDLTKNTVTQLVGPNGAGKSSWGTILEEAFFSKNSRGLKKDELPYRYSDDKGYSIKVAFDVDSAPHTLEITRSSSLRVTLYAGDDNISGHTSTQTYAILHKILGLDFNTFSRLIYQSMKSSLEFLTATDAKRKAFLVSLFDLGHYADKEKVYKESVSAQKLEVKSLEGALRAHEQILNKALPELGETKPEIKRIDISAELIDLKAAKLNVTKNNQAAKKNLTAKLNLELHENRILPNANPINPVFGDKEQVYSDQQADLRRMKGEMSKLRTSKSQCHACGSRLDNSKQLEMLADLEIAYETLSTKSNENFKELELLRKAKSEYEIFQDYHTKLAQLIEAYDETVPTEQISPAAINARIAELEEWDASNKAEVEAVLKHNQTVERDNARYQVLHEQQVTARHEVALLKADIAALEVGIHDDTELQKAYGSKGFVTYKIETMVKELEEGINEYLVQIADGRFILEFEAKGDKLNVVIYDNDLPVSVAALSSGEMQKVNLATLFAIRKLMSGFSKSHINLLILDEVVSVLDEEAKGILIEILMKEHTLNSFVVSHMWAHPLVPKITINKGELTHG